MRLIILGAILLVGCSDQGAGDSEAVPASPPASPTLEATAAPEVVESERMPPAVVRPSHNYDERRGVTYYYVAAISDEDRKRGVATGSVSAFQYLGKNETGDHVLASMNDDSSIAYRAKCSASCRIIDTDYGKKIAYSPTSIIGAAFDDAFNGRLRIAQETVDRLAPRPSPPAQTPAVPLPPPEQVPSANDVVPSVPEAVEPIP